MLPLGSQALIHISVIRSALGHIYLGLVFCIDRVNIADLISQELVY